jgi:hypothetical protein
MSIAYLFRSLQWLSASFRVFIDTLSRSPDHSRTSGDCTPPTLFSAHCSCHSATRSSLHLQTFSLIFHLLPASSSESKPWPSPLLLSSDLYAQRCPALSVIVAHTPTHRLTSSSLCRISHLQMYHTQWSPLSAALLSVSVMHGSKALNRKQQFISFTLYAILTGVVKFSSSQLGHDSFQHILELPGCAFCPLVTL